MPLQPSLSPLLINSGNKYILFNSNTVDYGIDFSQDNVGFPFDKDMIYFYDGGKYSIEQINIMVFDENFKITNNYTMPSRSFSGVSSVIAKDNETLYLFGSRGNMMTIDKLTGF